MISPASFNYYLECLARAKELADKACKAAAFGEFMQYRKRAKALLNKCPTDLFKFND